MAAGPGVTVVPFGLQEMAMEPSRHDNRLTGPFSAAGLASEYFVIMVFLILHRLFFTSGVNKRYGLILLIGVNLALLVATGNRGGFLSLLGGGVLFLWFLRKELGVLRTLRLVSTGTALLALASAVIITYSDFGVLFERLEGTTIEEGVPDTRLKVWPMAWEKIKERPILGHGPRYLMQGGEDGADYPDWEYQIYPHNLYLFLLSTIGVVGLIAFLIFILTPMARCYKTARLPNLSVEGRTFIKTGFVIFVVIMVDQLKVEFMRMALVDYWHFVFALLGVFVAACDSAKAGARNRAHRAGAMVRTGLEIKIRPVPGQTRTSAQTHKRRG
jgi:O-antigen ligase